MNAMREKYYRILFLVAAIYDISLGVIFTFFYGAAFNLLCISEKLPEYGGYISLIGAFLFVIGTAYYLIYRGDLKQNIELIKVGALYKLAYCAIVFFYSAIGSIPHPIFVTLFGVADMIFFILMLECIIYLGKIKSKSL